jgi:hypothetical protein
MSCPEAIADQQGETYIKKEESFVRKMTVGRK